MARQNPTDLHLSEHGFQTGLTAGPGDTDGFVARVYGFPAVTFDDVTWGQCFAQTDTYSTYLGGSGEDRA